MRRATTWTGAITAMSGPERWETKRIPNEKAMRQFTYEYKLAENHIRVGM